MDEERRLFDTEELRIDAGSDGKTRISGLAVPYNRASQNLGGFTEQIMPGAFADTLGSKAEVFADIEHDLGKKLARRSNRSLELYDSADGLRFTMTLPDTSVGKDTAEEVRNGLLDGVSVVFRDAKADWGKAGAEMVRRVTKATLRAVSLTSIPAYQQTVGTLTMRSLDEARQAAEAAEMAAEKAASEAEAARIAAEKPVESLEILHKRLDLAMAENH